MSKSKFSQSKYKSIRSILIWWFIVFSILPLVFMGWFFLYKFESALNSELVQRLKNNGREIENIVADYYSESSDLRDKILSNSAVYNALESKNVEDLKQLSVGLTEKGILSSLSFYDDLGSLLITTFRDEKRNLRHFILQNEKILLNENYLLQLKDKYDIAFVDYGKDKLNLMFFTKVVNSKKQIIGYFEQTVELNQNFLQKLKLKMKLESFLVNDKQNAYIVSKNIFKKIKINKSDLENQYLISTNLEAEKYGFIVYPFYWGQSTFYIGLGSINQNSQGILNTVKLAFISVLSLVVFLLFITILFTTDWFLKPVNRLIEGLRTFDSTDQILQLPVRNNTEIGLLTDAFNEMSYKIYQTRADLKKKIKELEFANADLKEAQTKLVHSAKMTSLGQLVAGVAHELNNPISFIFSNTDHLRDYSDKLIHLIDQLDKNPEKLNQLKDDIEYEYIKSDLPRLIKSCQDGAQRTRDIVLGLRNFSRLEEAQLKEIDIHESIETTLELLSGEIKNRIQVNKDFSGIPKVLCFASQINQVFMNILSNATHAVQGNGQLWITTAAIKPNLNQVAKVKVTIQDSGVGMDPDVVDKIFEPFFTTKGIGKGTGLGLSISYGIIQNHGGEIQVRSQKGVGTEFTIIIPVKPPIKDQRS